MLFYECNTGAWKETQKELVFLGIVAILICVGLSGCNQINNPLDMERNKFIGSWYNTQEYNPNSSYMHYWTNTTQTFLSDGTFSSIQTQMGSTMTGASGTWELKDGKLVMNSHWFDIDAVIVNNYLFSNNDKTLTLTNPDGTSPKVYTKL